MKATCRITLFFIAVLVLASGLPVVSNAAGAQTSPVLPPSVGPHPAGEAGEMQDIHDINALVLSHGNTRWVWWGLGALLLTLVAIAVLFYLKKRKAGEMAGHGMAMMPPEETAYRQLNQLNDISSMGGKEFYFRLSAILRRYVSERYAIGAAEMTTEEFVPRVDDLDLVLETRLKLVDLCRAADTIKFAKGVAIEQKMLEDLDYAKDFVRQTTLAHESIGH